MKFEDFKTEIYTLIEYFKIHGPKGPGSMLALYEFCLGKIVEYGTYYIADIKTEL